MGIGHASGWDLPTISRRRAGAFVCLAGFAWRGLAAVAAGVFGAMLAFSAQAETLMAGPAGAPMTLQAAIDAAKDGDTIDLLPGEYKGPVLIDKRRLTLRGVGAKPPVINGEGKVSATHALWVVRGGEVVLENLEFRGARAPDRSGGAVRQEGGRLTVKNCGFYDNESGIVSMKDETAELVISGSVFGASPRIEGGLFHLLNVGRIGKLDITASRFQQGFEGHLIKSRARENNIRYNFIHDGVRGSASYEIEIATGGVATIVGNVIGQGTNSGNRVLLSYGSEGQAWDRNELYVAHNTFINYGWSPAWFMRVFDDRLKGEVVVEAINNLLVGPGVFWLAASGHFEGNRFVTRGMLRDIWTHGFELPPDSSWRGAGIDPRNIRGRDLSPKAEFEMPANLRELKSDARSWTPGAYQR